LAQSVNVVPIPGTKKRKNLSENAQSVDIVLAEHDLAEIDQLLKKYNNVGPNI